MVEKRRVSRGRQARDKLASRGMPGPKVEKTSTKRDSMRKRYVAVVDVPYSMHTHVRVVASILSHFGRVRVLSLSLCRWGHKRSSSSPIKPMPPIDAMAAAAASGTRSSRGSPGNTPRVSSCDIVEEVEGLTALTMTGADSK